MLEDSKSNGIVSQIVKRITDIEEFIRAHKIKNHNHIVIQEVYYQTGAMQTNAATIPFDNTKPQITEGFEYFPAQTITPTNAANKLLLEVLFHGQANADFITVAIFQNATASAIASGINTAATGFLVPVFVRCEMIAGTITPIAFHVRAGASANALTNNGSAGVGKDDGILFSSFRITEIKV